MDNLTDLDKLREFVRASRIKRGWSAQKLADMVSKEAEKRGAIFTTTQQSISRFENGIVKREPSWLQFALFAFDTNAVPAPAPPPDFF